MCACGETGGPFGCQPHCGEGLHLWIGLTSGASPELPLVPSVWRRSAGWAGINASRGHGSDQRQQRPQTASMAWRSIGFNPSGPVWLGEDIASALPRLCSCAEFNQGNR